MKSLFKGMLDAGRRVQVFLNAQVALLAGVIPQSLRDHLDAAVAALGDFELEQSTNAGLADGELAKLSVLRADLYARFVVPAARTAKFKLQDSTELPNLTVPQSIVDDRTFVSAMERFRAAAAVHKDILVEHGMPADFLAQLDAGLDAVKASIDARGRYLARRKAATEGCDSAFKDVRSYVGIIDGHLRPALKDNPSLLRDWDASKRVRQVPVNPLPTGALVIEPNDPPATVTDGSTPTPVTTDPTPSAGEPPKATA